MNQVFAQLAMYLEMHHVHVVQERSSSVATEALRNFR
jgi:hypothetical protein